MLNPDEKIKFLSGHILSIILRTIGYTLFGVILNFALFISQREILFNKDIPLMSDPKTCAVLLGVIIFPVIFFVIGQKQAIQGGLSKILKDKKYDLIFWIVNKIQEKHPEAFEREGKVQMTTLKVIEYLTEVMRDLPSVVVRTLKYFVEKVNFATLFVEAVNTDIEIRKDETRAQRVSLVISNLIPGDVISPDIKWPLIVLVLNSTLFFV